MKRDFLKILIVFLLLVPIACRKSESTSEPSSGGGVFGLSDQTQEAADLVNSANGDLKKIKAIYKESEANVEELKASIQSKEVDKVKKMAAELVIKINEGVNYGNEAVDKLSKAQELNTNEKYKEYLNLKEQSLRKQLEAFDIRFEQTKYLRDEFQITDKQGIDRAKSVLNDMDEKFKVKMQAARELSQEANQIAKESLKKQN